MNKQTHPWHQHTQNIHTQNNTFKADKYTFFHGNDIINKLYTLCHRFITNKVSQDAREKI